jgi:two-component system chemotaxis response regulator CheY
VIKTVLVVDDSPTMRMLLEVHLKVIPDIRIVQAKDVTDALEAKRREMPAVIVSDVNMPGRTGFDLVEEIRDVQQDRLTAIVMVTTRGATEDSKRALRLGANAYVTKPIEGPVLIDAVTRLLA